MKNLKILLFMISFLTCAVGQAYFKDGDELYVTYRKQRIAILMGLGFDHIVKQSPQMFGPLWASKLEKIQSEFKEYYKNTDFELDFSIYPNRFTLWNTFSDPRYVAVFWVGHGSENAQGNLYDGDNFTVSDLFKTFHPNLRYLAIISCFSKQTVALPKGHPNLKVLRFNGKIDVNKSIKHAMKQSRLILDDPTVRKGYSCQPKIVKGTQIKIQRSCAGNNIKKIGHFPAVTISAGNYHNIIATFPPCLKENEVQTTYAHIKLDRQDFDENGHLINMDKMNIQISSGQRLIENLDEFLGLDMGDFKVSHNGSESWAGIVNPYTGGNTQVDVENLIFLGEVSLANLANYNEYLCQHMPARKN